MKHALEMSKQILSLSSSYTQSNNHEGTVGPNHAHLCPRRVLSHATRSASALLNSQMEDGSWCGPLLGDSTLLSDYILLQVWLDPPSGGATPSSFCRTRIEKVVSSIWNYEMPDGGWNLFPGGPPEINATVRAYTALKLAGEDSRSPRMKRLRSMILSMGGLQACNSYTKVNLSLFGLFPRQFAPTVPPELLLLPGNVFCEMSSWTRAMVAPLAIVQALGVTRPTPEGMKVDELLHPSMPCRLPKRGWFSKIFIQADRLFKLWEQRGVRSIRAKAIRAAERWMLEHMQHSEGLGGIFPGIMYSIMAMNALGYEWDQPDFVRALRQIEDLLLEHEDELQIQPARSPVWDTAITAFALGELGPSECPATTKAADWLLRKEVRRKGDWSEKRPNLTPSGWAFEFHNDFFPDIDDTAMVLLALLHAKASDREQQKRAEQRAINWLLGMQSSDGGWAAFDVDNDWQILNKVPFADHNAMLDPTCPDITGRVLECLCRRGMTHKDPAIYRGVRYLLEAQEQNGSWYGRWGVNYIYGTFLAMRGLHAANDRIAARPIQRAAKWLKSVQNEDGGWGESCTGYINNTFVPAESTPSQTAWALLGLIGCEGHDSQAVVRGIHWLLDNQRSDGTWDEKLATGTGFPTVYYLTYDMYRNYFPLLALAEFYKSYAKSGSMVAELYFTAASSSTG